MNCLMPFYKYIPLPAPPAPLVLFYPIGSVGTRLVRGAGGEKVGRLPWTLSPQPALTQHLSLLQCKT